MKVTIQTISDPSRILGIRDVWDRFLQRHSDNPFLLSGFIVQYMDDARSLDWTPLVMLISVDEALVGLVPLCPCAISRILRALMITEKL